MQVKVEKLHVFPSLKVQSQEYDSSYGSDVVLNLLYYLLTSQGCI